MDFSKELGYYEMINTLDRISREYEIVKLSYMGQSVLSRSIPLVTIGDEGAGKSVLYVSTHHASENICTCALVNFIEEYASAHSKKRQICGMNLHYLHKMRKIYIIPMLNPDGVEYRLSGVDESNPIKDRVIAYNEGSNDFSKWNSNARGVDLNHNYNAYFEEYKKIEIKNQISPGRTRYSGEYPESEPECAALANFIRYNSDKIEGILTLHTQGEEIYYKSQGITSPKSESVSRIISKMTGYRLCEAEGMASYGGLTDWFIKEYGKPSFTIECGKGENPLDISQLLTIYSKLRETLFTFPILL